MSTDYRIAPRTYIVEHSSRFSLCIVDDTVDADDTVGDHGGLLATFAAFASCVVNNTGGFDDGVLSAEQERVVALARQIVFP